MNNHKRNCQISALGWASSVPPECTCDAPINKNNPIEKRKYEVSGQYGKDNLKELHFYCEFCDEEMEFREDRVCPSLVELSQKECIHTWTKPKTNVWLCSICRKIQNFPPTPSSIKNECKCGCEGNNKDLSPDKAWDKNCIYHPEYRPSSTVKEECICPEPHHKDYPCYVAPKPQEEEGWEKEFDNYKFLDGGARAQTKLVLIKEFIKKTLSSHSQAVLKEVVICAAIRMKDGYVVRGHRHNNCIETASHIPRYKGEHPWGENQGFVTSKNRYVDRLEGARIQKAAGIKSKMPEGQEYLHGELYSEDLY